MNARLVHHALFLSTSFILGTIPALGDGPVGSQFQVNSYTASYQERNAVDAALNGDFVVVWDSLGSDGGDTSNWSVQGQRYAAEGAPLGSQFQVNSYTTSFQGNSDVGVAADGSFVVIWQSVGSVGGDTEGNSIQGQRYASDGAPLSSQFQVNSYTSDEQYLPDVGVAADGSFVVVWESGGSDGSDTSSYSIQGQRYAADGTPQGLQFQVNSYTWSIQGRTTLGVAADGDFVVVWESFGSDGSDTNYTSIQGQRYAADGTPLGLQFQANSYTLSFQWVADVGVAPNGDFVVVWESFGSYGNDSSSWSVQGQRFASGGTFLGSQFQVNSYTMLLQARPAISVAAGGRFVVVWRSTGSDGSDNDEDSIQGQRYAANGTPLSSQFQVNSYVTGDSWDPAVAMVEGKFVVVWDSFGSDGTDTDSWSVQGQRYDTQVFADGFESGDTSAWSATLP